LERKLDLLSLLALVVDLGEACAAYQDDTLVDLSCKTIECDEIWNFCTTEPGALPSTRCPRA
jgi:hypothetical protein